MERGAFGSGEHETTRSCIELLESVPPADQLKILDLGSGTGILSIAALLSNREATATCLDIDPVAVASCRRNCSLNQLDHRVKHSCGTLDQLDERNFDLVLANIYGDILLEIAADLVDRTTAGAIFCCRAFSGNTIMTLKKDTGHWVAAWSEACCLKSFVPCCSKGISRPPVRPGETSIRNGYDRPVSPCKELDQHTQ